MPTAELEVEPSPKMSASTQSVLGFAALVALPVVVLGDSLAAFARGWQTQSRLDGLLMGGMALALAIASALPIFQRGRRFLSLRCGQVAVCIVAISTTWLVGECVLLVLQVGRTSNTVHRRPPRTVAVFHPVTEIMPGIKGESRFTTNSLGVRGPELPPREGAHRILCVGGSTTECLYLDDVESWPYLLMENLNKPSTYKRVWVGNAGVSGYSTVRHLRFIQEDELWKEMDCVVFLVGANDFQGFLRNGIAMKTRSERALERVKNLDYLQPYWRGSPMLATARHILSEWSRPRVQLEDETGLNYVARRQLRQNGPVRTGLPNMSAALMQYEERIVHIIETCKAANVRPVFLTQPSLLSHNAPSDVQSLFWSGDDGHGGYFTVGELERGLQAYNRRLRVVCVREGVECIDLTSMNDHPEYFYDEYHFNEAGARAVANIVAEGFRSRDVNDISVSSR
jgi:lysophospholipase L1-like esterase